MASNEFKIGKLYTCSNKEWNSTYEKNSGKLRFYPAQVKSRRENYSSGYNEFSMDDPIMILELLYIRNTKRSHIDEDTFKVFNEWHAKILINETVGYVFIFENDWEQIV